ncbi:MAG: sulfotransferase [Rhodanobacteraceae bacterium]
MKLQVPFVQLPLRFDAGRLAAEMQALGDAAWRPHPQKYPGNFALPLIAAKGNAESDSVAGPMRPTPYLEDCPCIRDVLVQLGAVWGRSRLMKLGPHAEVSVHADTNYYWRERVRVHVPILTHPDVRFVCGTAEVNMAAGECWIFDTWRRHRVINAQSGERVHLVADTVGSEHFWRLVKAGRVPGSETAGWQPQQLQCGPSLGGGPRELLLESSNAPTVMTPWEMRYHLSFLLSETAPHPQGRLLEQKVKQFLAAWQVLWAEFGESRAGWQAYRGERDAFAADIRALSGSLSLVNGMGWMETVRAMVLKYAITDLDTAGEAAPDEHLGTPSSESSPRNCPPSGRDPEFDRPIFIISTPRSGSTLLFETLQRAPGLHSTGSESHRLIEGIPGLRSAGGHASNRLDADAATTTIASELRRRFLGRLHDREGCPPSALPVRMLEKTPKNALRIPFLARAFPEALFIYLHRDARQTLGSMMDAWQSGHFRTYPNLPGWRGLPWSLLLIPGWQTLIGKPLPEIVAEQWRVTTRQMVADLEDLPAKRCVAIDYDDFLAEPQGSAMSLCRALGLEWDGSIDGPLPVSRYTLTAPAQGKWRRHQDEIERVLPDLREEILLAGSFVEAHAVRETLAAAT